MKRYDETIREFVIPAALSLLPDKMDTPEARSMLMSIGYQESNFTDREQMWGPARGFWQFEWVGVLGVLDHHQSKNFLGSALEFLRYDEEERTPRAIHGAIKDNDILACILARLLLWTLPDPLPSIYEKSKGWEQYISAWRPGKPHIARWDANWEAGWGLV